MRQRHRVDGGACGQSPVARMTSDALKSRGLAHEDALAEYRVVFEFRSGRPRGDDGHGEPQSLDLADQVPSQPLEVFFASVETMISSKFPSRSAVLHRGERVGSADHALHWATSRAAEQRARVFSSVQSAFLRSVTSGMSSANSHGPLFTAVGSPPPAHGAWPPYGSPPPALASSALVSISAPLAEDRTSARQAGISTSHDVGADASSSTRLAGQRPAARALIRDAPRCRLASRHRAQDPLDHVGALVEPGDRDPLVDAVHVLEVAAEAG